MECFDKDVDVNDDYFFKVLPNTMDLNINQNINQNINKDYIYIKYDDIEQIIEQVKSYTIITADITLNIKCDNFDNLWCIRHKQQRIKRIKKQELYQSNLRKFITSIFIAGIAYYVFKIKV